MAPLIGLVLLLYGGVGFLAAVVAYLLLVRPQGPLARLKALLTRAANKLGEGVGAATRANQYADRARQALDDAVRQIGEALPHVRQLHDYLNLAAGFVRNVEGGLNGVTIPAPSPTTMSLPNLNVNVPTVTGIDATYYGKVPVANIDVYGPPYTPHVGSTQVTIPGPTGLPWLAITNIHPLQPVGTVVGSVAAEVEHARDEVGYLRATLQQFGQDAEEAKDALDELKAEVLEPLPGQLGDLRQRVEEFRDSRLLRLIPLAVLGYFALLHLAFALTGFALIVV